MGKIRYQCGYEINFPILFQNKKANFWGPIEGSSKYSVISSNKSRKNTHFVQILTILGLFCKKYNVLSLVHRKGIYYIGQWPNIHENEQMITVVSYFLGQAEAHSGSHNSFILFFSETFRTAFSQTFLWTNCTLISSKEFLSRLSLGLQQKMLNLISLTLARGSILIF